MAGTLRYHLDVPDFRPTMVRPFVATWMADAAVQSTLFVHHAEMFHA